MGRRTRIPDKTNYYEEFLEEHDGLWEEHLRRDGDNADSFSEFGTEMDPSADRWLLMARGKVRQPPPKVHDYRHTLAVASVVLSLFAPAGVISMVIVGRQLTMASVEISDAMPPLPSRVRVTSVDRLRVIPAVGRLPSPRVPAATAVNDSPAASRDRRAPVPTAANVPAAAAAPLLPLTTAVLSSTTTPAVPLPASPPPPAPAPAPAPARSNPPPPIVEAPAAPPPAAVVPTVTPSTPAESVAVRVALDRYRDAFNSLDAGRAKSIWPAVDEKTLSRAFSQMSLQLFVFDACNVDVTGPRAIAWCHGRAQYVPKVGSRTARVEARDWRFTLRRTDTHWTIESVDSR